MHALRIVLTLSLILTWATQAGVASERGDRHGPDPGLLRDGTFDAEERGEGRVWGRGQHAGEPSYRFHAEAGVLRIERFGPEPWGQVRQGVEASPFIGRTLEFSAELSCDFSEAQQRGISATGLGVRVRGYRAGMPKIAGKAILLTADGKPEIGTGCSDWVRQSVRFQVPEGATDIEVSVRLGMYGTLAVRGPRLVAIEPGGPESPGSRPGLAPAPSPQ